VGRRGELAELDRALDDALAGRGRLCLLVGEPGIGKTRLADEATARAATRGAPVLWGRCWESGGAPAYFPWLEVFASLVRRLDDDDLREALGDGAPLLGALLPPLRERLGPLEAATPPSPDEARFRLWRAVAGLCRRTAADAGLVLVFEDLHAADDASLSLLLYLARELRSMRALVIATYRDVEARLLPAIGERLARIAREGSTLPLARLDADATASFLRQRVGPAAAAVAARIFASTQGNPLFVEEMARLLGEQGADAIAAGEVPDGVREAIRQRLSLVPPDARFLLDLAAVAGDELDPGLLAEALSWDRARVARTIEEASRAGVLAVRAGRRRFSHALFREVLYRELGDEERCGLHGRLGAVLERRSDGQPTPPLAELAHHGLAGPAEGLARAVGFAIRAAERALGLVAYEESIAVLTRAAAAVAEVGDPGPLRGQILLALAETRIRCGDSHEGRALCREAAALARRSGDHEQLARAALTYGLWFQAGVVDPVLVSLLEEALRALPPGDTPARARLLARLAAALTPSRYSAEPVRLAREAIATARRIADPQTLLGTLYSAISALMQIVDPRERLPLNFEVEQLATSLGDREKLLRTFARLIVDHMELGDLAAADARIDALEALVRELRASWCAWQLPLLRSMRASLHGRFAEAERHNAEALRLVRATAPELEVAAVMQRAAFLRAAERHEEMVAHEPTARRALGDIMANSAHWQSLESAITYARLEDAEKTRFFLELIPPESRPPIDNLSALVTVAECAALVGPAALAEELHALLLPAATRDVMRGMDQMSWEGPVSRGLGLLAAHLGRWDDACAHFEAAIARCRRLDAAPFLARTQYEYGRALLAQGTAGARDRARALIATARTEAEALGMSGLLRLATGRLEGLDAPAAPAAVAAGAPAPALGLATPAPAAPPPFTVVAEGEYWAITHEGATFRLKDSLGLQYLARLIDRPGEEVHALDLVGGRRGEAGAVDAGDAGEHLDEEARETYRARLEDLRETLAEAESFGDETRAARAREEIEFLGAELGRAVGLSGRVRRSGSAAERARIAVQRRIRNAILRIGEHAPGLAALLARTVKTGNFCSYFPR
jgi:tetratricopeptide (TPR) repeat protein